MRGNGQLLYVHAQDPSRLTRVFLQNSIKEVVYMNNTGADVAKTRLLTRLFPWIICGLGAFFYIYEYVLRITPGVITSELMQFFSINALVVSNLAAFYYYAYTPMQLPVGVLMDKFGPRRLLTFACLVCAIGSYLFGSTHSLTVACLGRFMVGFGSAFAFVGVLKLATIWLPPNRFALMSGLASALGAVGAAVGMVTMQAILDRIDWQKMIYLTALSGLVLATVMFCIIKDRPKKLSTSETAIRWSDVWCGFLAVIKNKYMWLNGLIGCLLYLPASVFAELWGKQYLMAAHGFSSDQAVIGISFVFFGFALGGPLFGFISDQIGNRRIPIIIGAFSAAVLFLLLLFIPNLSFLTVDALLFIFGMAYGAQVIVFAIGREISPAFAAATAIAVTNMFVMLSGSIFETVVGGLLKMGWDHTMLNNIPIYSDIDFRNALLLIPIGLLLGGCCTFLLKETHASIDTRKTEQDKVISD